MEKSESWQRAADHLENVLQFRKVTYHRGGGPYPHYHVSPGESEIEIEVHGTSGIEPIQAGSRIEERKGLFGLWVWFDASGSPISVSILPASRVVELREPGDSWRNIHLDAHDPSSRDRWDLLGLGYTGDEQEDPTSPIVGGAWSEWLFYLDSKGSAVKGKLDVGEFPLGHKPGIYEIRRVPGSPDRGNEPQVVYVGQSSGSSMGVRDRLHSHWTTEDNLTAEVTEAVEGGDSLQARYIEFDTPAEAVRLEKELRLRLRPMGRYPWNKN
jgi:hypothetical protein